MIIQLGEGTHPARQDIVVHGGDPVDVLATARDAADALVNFTGWTMAAEVLAPNGVHVVAALIVAAELGGFAIQATPQMTADWARVLPVFSPWRVTATHPSGDPIYRTKGWLALYR